MIVNNLLACDLVMHICICYALWDRDVLVHCQWKNEKVLKVLWRLQFSIKIRIEFYPDHWYARKKVFRRIWSREPIRSSKPLHSALIWPTKLRKICVKTVANKTRTLLHQAIPAMVFWPRDRENDTTCVRVRKFYWSSKWFKRWHLVGAVSLIALSTHIPFMF